MELLQKKELLVPQSNMKELTEPHESLPGRHVPPWSRDCTEESLYEGLVPPPSQEKVARRWLNRRSSHMEVMAQEQQ